MAIVTCRACGHSFDPATSYDGRCPVCGNLVFVRADTSFGGEAGGAPGPDPSPAELQHAAAQQERVAFVQALWRATPRAYVALVIIGINVAVFALEVLLGAGLVQPHVQKILDLGANYGPYTAGGQWWRLLTCAFLHFGIIHIGFNMWAFYGAGPLTERLFGNGFFLLIYLFSALCASFASLWWEPAAVSAGASGAIFGVYGALIAFLVARRGVFPKGTVEPMLKSTLAFIAYNVIFGMVQKGISNSAHLGGLFSGFLMGLLLARPLDLPARRAQSLARLAGGILAGAAVLFGAFVAVNRTHAASLAFLRVVEDFQREEPKLARHYNELLGLATSEKITSEQFADRLEREALPGWQRLITEMSAIQLPENTRTRGFQGLFLEYLRLEHDSDMALIEGMRKDDRQAVERSAALRKRAEKLIPSINQAIEKLRA